MSEFKILSMGMLMELGNPQGVEGVLNPAAVRGRTVVLYLCELPSQNSLECAF
jgi:hypothetical protein